MCRVRKHCWCSSEDNNSLSHAPAQGRIFDPIDQLWLNIISNKNRRVHRIRCYNTYVTPDDKFGHRCSIWCVNNGFTITCLELAKLLPRSEQNNGQALSDMIKFFYFAAPRTLMPRKKGTSGYTVYWYEEGRLLHFIPPEGLRAPTNYKPHSV